MSALQPITDSQAQGRSIRRDSRATAAIGAAVFWLTLMRSLLAVGWLGRSIRASCLTLCATQDQDQHALFQLEVSELRAMVGVETAHRLCLARSYHIAKHNRCIAATPTAARTYDTSVS